MPAPKRADEERRLTVRTAPLHCDVIDELAGRFGVSKSDMAAIVLADGLGLDRPAGKPAISLEPSSLPALANEIAQSLRDQEVMPQTA